MSIKNLKDLREVWEATMEELQTFDMQKTHGSVIVMLKEYEKKDKFKVMCYFQLGENWFASCDLDRGNIKEALSAVNRRLG